MFTSIKPWLVLCALVFLVACSGGANPVPAAIQTLVPSAVSPIQQPGATPTAVTPFPQGITNEPLAVVTTSPADKSDQIQVAKDSARLIVQFNHPVVPLVAVEAQKDLPQPLTLEPGVQGKGQWINTSTFAFLPSQNLAVATQYTASLQPLKDMLGQSLAGFSWSFKTESPAVLKTDPADNALFVGTTQPITLTFNTEMDRASTESRLSIKRQDTGAAAVGKFEWQGTVLRFVPTTPLDYNQAYKMTLLAGAQEVNKLAATAKDASWAFKTIDRTAVRSTSPREGDTKAAMDRGFVIEFASPMRQPEVKVTVQPTITNQVIWWENTKSNKNDESTTAHVGGGWLASTAYTVTIGGESPSRNGERLGTNVVVHFTTAPRPPALEMNLPGELGMYDVNGPQAVVAGYVNLKQIDYKLYKVDRADFLGLLRNDYYGVLQKFTPKEANQLRAWSLSTQAPLNAKRLISTTLTVDSAPLRSGVYLLQASSPDLPAAQRNQKHILLISSLNLAFKRTQTEALVWVTDLKSGKPVADQPLTLYGTRGNVLASGKSDKDGVWRPQFPSQNAWDQTYVVGEADGQVVAAVGSGWSSGIQAWDFNMPSQPEAREYYANLYTDRSIYRPGQTVYYKGVLRRDNDAQYSLPQGLEVIPIKVRDGQGKEIATQNVSLTRFGTFDGQVRLSESASIGFYNLSMELGADPQKFISGVNFQVAEYRRPEFQVTVKADQAEYFNGDKIKVDAAATYFFGGAVKDANVTWRLLSDDLAFQPENVKGYWQFTDYDLAVERRHQGGVVREGKGKTDAAGNFHFEVPADLKDFPLSQNFTLEAEVVDINNQSVSSRIVVPVHKAHYYIGLRPQRYVGTVNQEQAVDVLTVDTKGSAVPNQVLTVSFFEHQWYSVREKRDDGGYDWKSAYTDTLTSKVTVTTNSQGQAVGRFTPSKGGVYKVVAEGKDTSNNAVRSATYLWIAGQDFVNWRMENNDRIELIADKKQYSVGETAEVLIPAPFKGAEALLTIERGTIRQVRRLTLQGNSERIQIPIQSDYAPNVFISVFLVKGRGADSPTPQFKLGYTNLSVNTTEKELKVTVQPDKQAHYGPGEKATFNIQVADSKDRPVETELSVALVDKAIQSLADDMAQSPLQAFYGQRGLGVQTSATLVRSVERLNQTLTPEAKGGGGGLLAEPVRRDFRDTAFWKADVVTDASGRAQVSVPLPDNLTTWNLTAKGVTAATQVGIARTDIMSTKDLLVRPYPPRFFVIGDKARLEVVVNNNSGKDVSADVRIDAQGLTLSGNAQQPITIRANDKAKVGWDTTVNAVEQVVLKFSVQGGGLQDAVEQTVPVLRPTSAETVATAGQVETKVAEQIQLPSVIDKSAGELKIELSPSLAAASRDSLDYLDSYEYECSEQTVSKFFPNVATYLALKKLGIDREDLRTNLERNVSREVQRLYALQNQDGGWGWWLSEESRPVLTAYAMLGLYNAKQAGFAVDSEVMKRAEQYLVRSFESPLDAKQTYTYNERAFVIFVLTEMGNNYTSRAVNLFDQRINLGNYGKAFLLMAMQRLKLPQVQPLAAELTSAAIPSATGAHWEEAKIDYWTMNTNTRSTALAIMALARGGQGTPSTVLSNAVRWLMVARKEGHWETTQETAWSVLALTDFMQSTGELQGNYSYQATFNGKAIGDGLVNKSNVDQAKVLRVAVRDMVTNAANELAITRGSGDGRLYYSAYLNYYLPVENMSALNKGIIVARQYEAVDRQTLKSTGQIVQSAQVDDYVQVTLTIIAPNDLHYLVLEDWLPAGFEAVDRTLKTASVAAQGPELKEKQPPKEDERWFRPYWSYWAHSEVRDDRVAAFATYLGRGTYEYTYMMHASVPGEFRALPARAYEMYFPDVFGRSSGALFSVRQ